jgi:hypothetical protein
MVRASSGAGAVLRPNSSLAGVAGSSGLANGGSGVGLTLPRSCAATEFAAKNGSAASNSMARQPKLAIGTLDLVIFGRIRIWGPAAPRSNRAPVPLYDSIKQNTGNKLTVSTFGRSSLPWLPCQGGFPGDPDPDFEPISQHPNALFDFYDENFAIHGTAHVPRLGGRGCVRLHPHNPRFEGYEVNVSEQQLKGAPKYSKHESWDWSDRARGQKVYDYYSVGPYWGS